jgi:hypothetical protein
MARKATVVARVPRKHDFANMLGKLKTGYAGRLTPPLQGYVYRFTIYLPLLSEGKEVFSNQMQILLADLFLVCCGGFSETSREGHPPWCGSWVPPGAAQPVIDRHTLTVFYTPQVEEAKDFFRQLRWILERKEVANQDVVLIEHTTAWLVEVTPLPEEN